MQSEAREELITKKTVLEALSDLDLTVEPKKESEDKAAKSGFFKKAYDEGKLLWGILVGIFTVFMVGWAAYQQYSILATKDWVTNYETPMIKDIRDDVEDVKAAVNKLSAWAESQEETRKKTILLERYREEYNIRVQEWVKISNEGAKLERPKKYPAHIELEAELLGAKGKNDGSPKRSN